MSKWWDTPILKGRRLCITQQHLHDTKTPQKPQADEMLSKPQRDSEMLRSYDRMFLHSNLFYSTMQQCHWDHCEYLTLYGQGMWQKQPPSHMPSFSVKVTVHLFIVKINLFSLYMKFTLYSQGHHGCEKKMKAWNKVVPVWIMVKWIGVEYLFHSLIIMSDKCIFKRLIIYKRGEDTGIRLLSDTYVCSDHTKEPSPL